MAGEGGTPTGKINGSRGKKKTRRKREEKPTVNFPPFGCKIDLGEGGGRENNMNHLQNLDIFKTLWTSRSVFRRGGRLFIVANAPSPLQGKLINSDKGQNITLN